MFLFYIRIYVKILPFERISKTLIIEENKISICSERKVVDNFYTIGVTIIAFHQLFVIISTSYPATFSIILK